MALDFLTIIHVLFYIYYYYAVAGATGLALRLVGGTVPWAGIVQVVVNGINGTVCSNALPDSTTAGAANVTMAICRDQGYTGVLRSCKCISHVALMHEGRHQSGGNLSLFLFNTEDTSQTASLYGTLSGYQWIDTPVCTNNENSIFNCTRRSLGPILCSHVFDLAVECIGRLYNMGALP